MSIKKLLQCALLATITSSMALSPASARVWKPSPDKLARDYATINDVRSNGELILLMWFASPAVQPESPGATSLKSLLQKYIVLTAINGRLDRSTGALSFDDIGTLQAQDQNQKPLALLSREDLPPSAAAVLTAAETLLRQSVGAMGKAAKVFVFEAGDVDACVKSELSVPFAGETYTWQAPMPGCPSI